MSLEPLIPGRERMGPLTSHLQTGTELPWSLEKQQEGECWGTAAQALQCQETSSPPPCLTPSQCPGGPLSNKGKAFTPLDVRWIGWETPAPEHTEANPNWSTYRGEGREHLLNPEWLGFLCPSLDTIASPGRAVSGNLRLGCCRMAKRRECSSRMSFLSGSTFCLNCKSTILCHNSDCSCSWPEEAQAECNKHQSTSLLISSFPAIILKRFKKQKTICTQNTLLFLKKCNHTDSQRVLQVLPGASPGPWPEAPHSLFYSRIKGHFCIRYHHNGQYQLQTVLHRQDTENGRWRQKESKFLVYYLFHCRKREIVSLSKFEV